MLTDKQFEDYFTAAGGWFILTQYETILNWNGTKVELVEELYGKGFDSKLTGTRTRVNGVLRLLEENHGKRALEKIRDSQRINREHPEAQEWADSLLRKYCS